MDLKLQYSEEQLRQKVERYAREFVRGPFAEEAEEVVQEVVLQFRRRLCAGAPLVTELSLEKVVELAVWQRMQERWLHDELRERRDTGRRRRHLDDGVESPDDGIRQRMARRVLAGLPRRAREAFHLVEESGLSIRQAARRMGLPRSAVYAHVATVKRRFRNEVRRLGIRPGARNHGSRIAA